MTDASNYSEEFANIATLLASAWGSGSPFVAYSPILWPGISSAVPTDVNGNKIAHIRFFIMNGTAEQVSIGGVTNINRHPNILSVKVFTPQNQGELPARALADKFCSIFRNLISDNIRFKTPYCVVMGNTEDGYYQINCFCPFERDSLL